MTAIILHHRHNGDADGDDIELATLTLHVHDEHGRDGSGRHRRKNHPDSPPLEEVVLTETPVAGELLMGCMMDGPDRDVVG